MRDVQVKWLQNFDPVLAAPASVQVPEVNGKTTPRSVSVSPPFAKLIHEWLCGKPLEGPKSQWAFQGQPVDKAAANLFAGMAGQGKRRWLNALSQRGYL